MVILNIEIQKMNKNQVWKKLIPDSLLTGTKHSLPDLSCDESKILIFFAALLERHVRHLHALQLSGRFASLLQCAPAADVELEGKESVFD